MGARLEAKAKRAEIRPRATLGPSERGPESEWERATAGRECDGDNRWLLSIELPVGFQVPPRWRNVMMHHTQKGARHTDGASISAYTSEAKVWSTRQVT